LLDGLIALDAKLGERIDGGPGRAAVVERVIDDKLAFTHAAPADPWQAFVMNDIVRALHDDAPQEFAELLQREPWLLEDACAEFQVGLIEQATLQDREAFITALLTLDPALLRRRPPPRSQAIEFVFTYVKPHLLPTLHRVWPLPDDLPHAAGNGDFPAVRRWFDAAGKPALGDLANHFPANSPYNRGNLQWGAPAAQQVLDTALAWSVLNGHFAIADFLLERGADINTRWGSHEPASILHELVFHGNYEAMQFLIDRSIDMTILDYRWHATAQGWAYHAADDKDMAQWLADAQRRQEET
jgi:Ankyrin repeats (many copies)